MHTYQDVGEYHVELIAESDIGCTDTAIYLIKILPTTSYTPNAFRPDSPIEVNRTFMPVGENAFQLNFKLKIYDRLGQLVFETNSTNNPWDGTTQKEILHRREIMSGFQILLIYKDLNSIKKDKYFYCGKFF